MGKKKVLFVFNDFKGAGIERILSILSEELSKKNKYELYLALFKNIQGLPFHGKIIDLNAPTSGNPILLVINIFKRVIKLKNIIISEKIDLVCPRSLLPNFIVLLAKRIFKFDTPVIPSYHNDFIKSIQYMGISGIISQKYNLKYQKYANKIICVSNGLSEDFAKKGFIKNKIVTIYNPVNIKNVDKLSKVNIDDYQEIFKKRDRKIIISVGRLVEQKNFPLLIESFVRVRRVLKCVLVIIGDGPEKENLERIIEERDLKDNVILLGWKGNPFNYVKRSDVFVLPSLWEGFGNVIIEAMACGTPVISTACPSGPDEIIKNEQNGLLVPVNDADSMAEAIKKVLNNEKISKKLIINGKKRAKDFSVEKIAIQYEELFNEFC